MSKSRKWVTSVLVAASMAVVGTASALDDALVEAMASDIAAALQSAPANATDDQKAAAVKAALDGKTQYAGKVDELIQALADAKIADAVATKVVISGSSLTLDQATQNLSAAKIVTETKSSTGPANPVTAAGNQNNQQPQQQQQQQPIVSQQPSTPVFQAPIGGGTQITSSTPSSQGAGQGVSRT